MVKQMGEYPQILSGSLSSASPPAEKTEATRHEARHPSTNYRSRNGGGGDVNRTIGGARPGWGKGSEHCRNRE